MRVVLQVTSIKDDCSIFHLTSHHHPVCQNEQTIFPPKHFYPAPHQYIYKSCHPVLHLHFHSQSASHQTHVGPLIHQGIEGLKLHKLRYWTPYFDRVQFPRKPMFIWQCYRTLLFSLCSKSKQTFSVSSIFCSLNLNVLLVMSLIIHRTKTASKRTW